MTDGVLRYGRTLFKVGMANLFTETGLIDLLGRMRRAATGPRVHVFGYHRVVDHAQMERDAGPVNPSLCISIDSFRRQMRQIRERFQLLSLAEVIQVLDGELTLEEDACAVTFDDGYADVILRAHEVLAELHIPGTVFVPTGYVGSTRYLPHDRLYAALWRGRRRHLPFWKAPLPFSLRRALEPMLQRTTPDGLAAVVNRIVSALPARSLEQVISAFEGLLDEPLELDEGARVLGPTELRDLAGAGWEIGAHTIGHVVLTHEPLEQVHRELVEPRRQIEAWTGFTCRYLAYCNGYHCPTVVSAARAAGYAAAVTTCDRTNGPGGDRMRIGRKCLWEGHTRGPDGQFSPAVSAAHLHDLFGTLGMTTPVDGEVSCPREEVSCGI
jgi:peptidoglycan/xylan/chitin deacetylase (PgdA/CDA1 family)